MNAMIFIAERAEGMYLYDEKGMPYLDFYGGVAVNSPGNCNPEVVKATKGNRWMISCIHSTTHIRSRRHYWLRRSVIRLGWIRSSIRIPEQKRMSV